MYVDPSGNYAAVARTYDVPRIGNVILAATGILIIGSIVISTGSWLYNKAVNWIKSWGAAQLAQAIKNIPNKLKKSNDVVDLCKFNNKKPRGGPPTWIGPLGYMIKKDGWTWW